MSQDRVTLTQQVGQSAPITVKLNKTCKQPLKLNVVFYVRIFLVTLKNDEVANGERHALL